MKAALFDLDGVLLDTEGVYTQIWSDIDRAIPTGVDDFARKIKGTNLTHILDTYYPDPATRLRVRAMLQQAEEHMKYVVFPGALEYVDALAARSIPSAIVTSSADDKMEYVARALPDFLSHFAVMITGSEVTRSKPDPQGYILAASRLGFAPEDCTVFEDSINGLKAGRAAGARVVALATTNPRELLVPLADEVYDTIADIPLP